MRAVLVEFLRSSGARVYEAADGAEALALLPRLARVDAAFLDLSMPNLGGMEVLEALRSAGRRFPVVLMTGHESVDLSRFEGEANLCVLHKPFPLDQVASALARAGVPAAAPSADSLVT